MTSIFRKEIYVGGDDTRIELTGPIVHVASRHEGGIEIWWANNPDAVHATTCTFRVVATGENFDPDELHHVGSAVTPSGQFVWHLMEVMHSDPSR